MTAHRTRLVVGSIAAAVLLIVLAVYAPREAAAGWLIAFMTVTAVPLGALALIMIHNLTGGAWGDDLRPLLNPAASCLVLLAPLFVPVVVGLWLIYPWAAGGAHTPADVAQIYLNAPLFVLRAVVAFVAWGALGILLAHPHDRPPILLSAAGLIFHAIAMTLLATDWILSVEPVFVSSSFGATIIFIQLYAALAFAFTYAAGQLRRRSRRDRAGLLLAVALGTTYINFMAVLVIWYGDLPHKAIWFVERTRPPWNFVAVAAFLTGSLAPILALLLARVRTDPRALRWVGATALLGIALYMIWLLSPPFGALALVAAVLAGITMTAAMLVFATSETSARRTFWLRSRHG